MSAGSAGQQGTGATLQVLLGEPSWRRVHGLSPPGGSSFKQAWETVVLQNVFTTAHLVPEML